jgi:BirA family transcriptional regulator, biotin operon repressor / biotin---[acetyl-CoA-carboxylase] ligase
MEKKTAIAQLIFLPQVDSTNNYAMNLVKQGWKSNQTVVWTEEQVSGRGQRGNIWISEAGMNLTFSMIVYPANLPAWQFFYLSMACSLAIEEFVSRYCRDVSIKWPNDIYIGAKKVAGLLIENTLEQDWIKASVIGTGINLNQVSFPENLPNPVSIRLSNGRHMDIRQSLEELYLLMTRWLSDLKGERNRQLRDKYVQHLYGSGQVRTYRDSIGSFNAAIEGVEESGELLLRDSSNRLRKYSFREVELVNY